MKISELYTILELEQPGIYALKKYNNLKWNVRIGNKQCQYLINQRRRMGKTTRTLVRAIWFALQDKEVIIYCTDMQKVQYKQNMLNDMLSMIIIKLSKDVSKLITITDTYTPGKIYQVELQDKP